MTLEQRIAELDSKLAEAGFLGLSTIVTSDVQFLLAALKRAMEGLKTISDGQSPRIEEPSVDDCIYAETVLADLDGLANGRGGK